MALDLKMEVQAKGRLWLNKGKARIPTRKGSEIVLAEVAKQFGLAVGVRVRGMLNRLTEEYAHTIRGHIVKVIVEQRGKNWPAYSPGYLARKTASPQAAFTTDMLRFTGHLTRNIKVVRGGLGANNAQSWQIVTTGYASNPLSTPEGASVGRGKVRAGRTALSTGSLIEVLQRRRPFWEQGVEEGKAAFATKLASANISGLLFGEEWSGFSSAGRTMEDA